MTAPLTLASTTVRADLDEQAASLFNEHWPEFIFHDAGVKPFWARRGEYFADWDFYALDEGRLVGAGYGVPLRWDGTPADLPGGYTDALRRSVTEHEDRHRAQHPGGHGRHGPQGRGRPGWAAAILQALREEALGRGLVSVIAPVRPTLKQRYPLTPIETFAAWTRADGLPLDPWVRTHVRLGASVLGCAPRSQTITGSVAEWESWTGLALPGSGEYVIPDGLALLSVDREADTGVYHEPNIWMRHV